MSYFVLISTIFCLFHLQKSIFKILRKVTKGFDILGVFSKNQRIYKKNQYLCGLLNQNI